MHNGSANIATGNTAVVMSLTIKHTAATSSWAILFPAFNYFYLS